MGAFSSLSSRLSYGHLPPPRIYYTQRSQSTMPPFRTDIATVLKSSCAFSASADSCWTAYSAASDVDCQMQPALTRRSRAVVNNVWFSPSSACDADRFRGITCVVLLSREQLLASTRAKVFSARYQRKRVIVSPTDLQNVHSHPCYFRLLPT